MTQNQIGAFDKRLKQLEEEGDTKSVTVFTEITVSEKQMDIMAKPMFGTSKENFKNYYKGKLHGNLLLTASDFTTREDQPDFQYLFDLGVQALKSGMELKK